MAYALHAFNACYPVRVCKRQGLREVDFVYRYQPVGSGKFDPGIEGFFKTAQYAIDQEGDEYGDQQHDGSEFASEKIFANEGEIVHAAISCSINSPLSRCSTRLA